MDLDPFESSPSFIFLVESEFAMVFVDRPGRERRYIIEPNGLPNLRIVEGFCLDREICFPVRLIYAVL